MFKNKTVLITGAAVGIGRGGQNILIDGCRKKI